MTNEQKNQIIRLRHDGFGYKAIAQALCITDDAVKSFCRRNNLSGAATKDVSLVPHFCVECGKEALQTPHRREKKFCSYECRMLWWKHNPPQVKRSMTMLTCQCCGKEFYGYESAGRKYCSHACYIRARYKGGDLHE